MSRFGDLLEGKKATVPAPPTEEVIEETVEIYESDVSFNEMSKKELEEYGRTVGIELDRRHSQKRLVKELEEYLETNS